MRLSSIVFHVTSNGPPNGPAPPRSTTPPLIVEKWIWTELALCELTPPEIVAFTPGDSSSPKTNVAPAPTSRPPRIVNGPAPMMQTAPSGTVTWPYVPGASVEVQLVPDPARDGMPRARVHSTATPTAP